MTQPTPPRPLHRDTLAVREAVARSQYGENSEALYLTSGYVQPSAEAAARRFAGEEDGYTYGRYGNPTVSSFEQRLAALEGLGRYSLARTRELIHQLDVDLETSRGTLVLLRRPEDVERLQPALKVLRDAGVGLRDVDADTARLIEPGLSTDVPLAGAVHVPDGESGNCRLFAQILRIPVYILHPLIFGVSVIGAYSVSGRLFDVLMLAGFGALGFAMSRLKFPVAPLVLGFVLGDAMERALRQSLMMSQGDLSILISRPISAGMLIFAVAVLFLPLLPRFRRLKEAAG
jgi:hypothetical protein